MSTRITENSIAVSGLSYRELDVSLREKFSIPTSEYSRVVSNVLRTPNIAETTVVSTCNRVEIVTVTENEEQNWNNTTSSVEDVFKNISGLSSGAFSKQLYHLKGKSAVRHIFRVASGLDSMIVGEPQILGQLKSAYSLASELNATKGLLNKLFHRSFSVAKLVRTSTRIGHNAVSVCFAAKELADQIFGDLSQAVVMLIGAGEMAQLAVKHFYSAGVRQFLIVNRTLERSLELAELVNGVPLNLQNFFNFLPNADIIIGSAAITTETGSIISLNDVKKAFKQRSCNPQFYIDLGVPRNFDPHISECADVFLYNIDDLQNIVKCNLDARIAEVDRAEIIVQDEVEKFTKWLEKRSLEPSIRELVEKCYDLRNVELDKTMRRIRKNSFDPQQIKSIEEALDDFSRALISKTLHQPIAVFKDHGDKSASLRDIFQQLFLKKHLNLTKG